MSGETLAALLGCPFCGKPLTVVHDTSSDYQSHWTYRPECWDCFEGPNFKTREEAVAWANRRAPHPAEAKLEAIKAEALEDQRDFEDAVAKLAVANDKLTEAENIARLNGAGRDRALAQLEGARRDGGRLTWLDQQRPTGFLKSKEKTWRQAIDAARAKESSDNAD